MLGRGAQYVLGRVTHAGAHGRTLSCTQACQSLTEQVREIHRFQGLSPEPAQLPINLQFARRVVIPSHVQPVEKFCDILSSWKVHTARSASQLAELQVVILCTYQCALLSWVLAFWLIIFSRWEKCFLLIKKTIMISILTTRPRRSC